MKQIVLIVCAILSLSSCKDNKDTAKEVIHDVKEVIANEETLTALVELGCFEYSKDNNKVRFKITNILEDSITGTLSYAYAEKDANQGVFKGTLNDDKLIGTYTFTSEGVESKREVAFKVNDSVLIEGYGELSDSGTAFQDRATIKYTSTMPLVRTACE
ncbi:hypothetical protein AB9K24_10215 [Meridianimaribacter flavus]